MKVLTGTQVGHSLQDCSGQQCRRDGAHLLWSGGLCSQGFFLGSTLVHTCGVIGAMACTASEST